MIGCGFIGSNVAVHIASGGSPLTVLTRSRPSPEVAAAISSARLLLGDASDPKLLAAALEGVDDVAFCAGGLLPAASERDPERDRQLTLEPVRTVLAALRERPGVTLTYLSSGGTVYGEPARLPVRESDPAMPVTSYGALHLECEEEIGRARREHELEARILRCSTVYGEHQRPDRGQGVIATFLHRISRGEAIDVYGDGSTIRDYVYAADVARVMTAMIGHGQPPPVINVGSGEGSSLLHVLALAERAVGRSAEIRRHPEREFDIHQIVLDTTLLHETVEIEMTPLAEGIERTRRWLGAGGTA